MSAPDLDSFRQVVRRFLAEANESGVACPAFGAILPPALHDQALAWQAHCAASGFAGIHWPTEYGGRGLTRAHNAVWFEECARAETAPYLNLQGLVLAGEAIMRAGTPAQRDRFLAPTLTGDLVWCQLFSEPESGSDLASLSSRAMLDGDNYVLNGQKVWSSNAQFAGYGILMARTSTELSRHKGISFFLLDMNLPGVEVRPLRQMTGDSEFCEVFFTDVVMPADALLGDEHEGWAVAMAVLEDERGSVGAAGAIEAERRVRALAGLGGGGDPVARQRVAGLFTRGEALRALLERRGGDPAAAPLTKVLRSELSWAERGLETDLLGVHALLAGEAVEDFLYAPGMRIAGGSSEIQRNIIGERALGLPREPR